jgi:mRNA-degrading endonuclease toxin of MazEF toxin-antitoxin module
MVQNDVRNLTSTTTIVACISSQTLSKRYPFHVWLPDHLLGRPAIVMCEQIRTVSLERFDDTELAVCPDDIMREVEQAVRVSLDLPDIV